MANNAGYVAHWPLTADSTTAQPVSSRETARTSSSTPSAPRTPAHRTRRQAPSNIPKRSRTGRRHISVAGSSLRSAQRPAEVDQQPGVMSFSARNLRRLGDVNNAAGGRRRRPAPSTVTFTTTSSTTAKSAPSRQPNGLLRPTVRRHFSPAAEHEFEGDLNPATAPRMLRSAATFVISPTAGTNIELGAH